MRGTGFHLRQVRPGYDLRLISASSQATEGREVGGSPDLLHRNNHMGSHCNLVTIHKSAPILDAKANEAIFTPHGWRKAM